MKIVCLVLLGIISGLYAREGCAQDAKRGADAYKLCASCHGFKAEGSQIVNAPSLAGQESWYLTRQIKNFRERIRGSSTDDVHGQTMAQMTMALDTDDDIADIVAYIGTLPIGQPKTTLDGDIDRGRSHYTPCAVCHGAEAEGNETLNAPMLVGIDDWYQFAQLEKFKNGTRGANPRDTYGMQMAPMTAVLTDDEAMRDVIAFISSLQ